MCLTYTKLGKINLTQTMEKCLKMFNKFRKLSCGTIISVGGRVVTLQRANEYWPRSTHSLLAHHLRGAACPRLTELLCPDLHYSITLPNSSLQTILVTLYLWKNSIVWPFLLCLITIIKYNKVFRQGIISVLANIIYYVKWEFPSLSTF